MDIARDPATAIRNSEKRFPKLFTYLATLIVLPLAFLPATAHAIDVNTAKLINLGFNIFTTTTFNGNGRTCSTCHLPTSDFTISAADISALSAHQRSLVLAQSVVGGLENPTLVQKLGIFNVNDGVGGDPDEVGNTDTPAGPFRASMSIAGLAFTTANILPDFCANNSPPQLIENGTDLIAVICSPLPPAFPANATAFALTDVFTNVLPPTLGTLTPGVDDGTRNIELGWAGDGAITDPDIFGPATTLQNQDCKSAVDEANDDTTDLTKSLRSFSLAAVKTHFPRSLNRVPGVDFRCPTSAELDALAAFQEYLGRRFELALKAGVPTDADDGTNTTTSFASGTQVNASQPVITFNDATAETGKAIFLDGNSQCNLCHFNAGANDATGLVHAPNTNDPSAPFPGRNFTSKQLVDLLRCSDVNGSPTTCMNGATATAHGLNAMVAPIVLPQDSGDKVANGATALSLAGSDCNSGINSGGNTGCINGSGMKAGATNIQSLIEAARKKSFFHNGAFNTLEGALSFYFSPTGDLIKAFTAPRKGETGAVALSNLANTYFSDPTDSKDVLNSMGFFLRSLSSVYAIADCERLVRDSITLVRLGQPVTLQAQLCTEELNDVNNMITGAQVKVPNQYIQVAQEARALQPVLKLSAALRLELGLNATLLELQKMRHSIATITPDLPN
jgi:cytochrome c peroxidase